LPRRAAQSITDPEAVTSERRIIPIGDPRVNFFCMQGERSAPVAWLADRVR
jgi:hypothetical protein